MDPNLVTLLVALVGPTGIAGIVALLLNRRSTAGNEEPPAVLVPPAGAPERRASDALGAVLDELVEARAETRGYRQQIWRCSVEDCPVRDRLRSEA